MKHAIILDKEEVLLLIQILNQVYRKTSSKSFKVKLINLLLNFNRYGKHI